MGKPGGLVNSCGWPGRTWPETQRMKVKPAARTSLRTERFIESVARKVFLFIKQTFPSPELINFAMAGLNRGEEAVGRSALSRIQTSPYRFAKSPAILARTKSHTNCDSLPRAGAAKSVSSVATRPPASPEPCEGRWRVLRYRHFRTARWSVATSSNLSSGRTTYRFPLSRRLKKERAGHC